MDPWMRLPEAPIAASGSLATRFRERGCATLRQAAYQLYTLPYGRNSDRSDFLLVLSEGRGTCSTKHALLAALAQELGVPIRLMLGIFEMCEANTPGVGVVLERHRLSSIPEAHTYLRYESSRVDITRSAVEPSTQIHQFICEQEIRPDQIGTSKISFHRDFIREWLSQHRELSGFTPEALWNIREECISALGSV
jgi:hypothetical protein